MRISSLSSAEPERLRADRLYFLLGPLSSLAPESCVGILYIGMRRRDPDTRTVLSSCLHLCRCLELTACGVHLQYTVY